MDTLQVASKPRKQRGLPFFIGLLAFLLLTVVLFAILGAILLEKHRFEFLAAYSVAGLSTLLAVFLLREIAENGELSKWKIDDPKLIACLRGGVREVIRITTVSLVERGFLKLDWNVLIADSEKNTDEIACPVERRILELTRESQPAALLLADRALLGECESFEAELRAVGFAPNHSQIRRRLILCVTGLLVVLGIGISKVVIALSQGRKNIWFTMGLMVLFSIPLCLSVRPNRTRLGKKFLKGLQHLYRKSLFQADRFRAEGRLDELILLASAFGIGALGRGKYAPDWFEMAKGPGPFSLSQIDPNSANFQGGVQDPFPLPIFLQGSGTDFSSTNSGGTSDWSGGWSGSTDYGSGFDTATTSSCGGGSFSCGGGGASCGGGSSGCGG